MMITSRFENSTFDDFDALTPESVILSDEAMPWAYQQSQTETDPDQQWKIFLTALAVAGFEQWLQSGGLAPDPCRRLNITSSPGINLQVGDFCLSILAMGSLSEDQVTISETTLGGTQCAHLYVLAEVQEEINQVRIVAGLRPDRLRAQIGQLERTPEQIQAGEYTVPIHWFETTPEQILLYLTCLEPEALLAPSITSVSSPAIRLESMIQGLGQGAESMTTGVLNVGRWLQDQLDEVATQWQWILLPPIGLSSMRASTNRLEVLLNQLISQGVAIPSQARGAQTQLQLAETALTLYALIWPLPETQEWSLFLCLGPENGDLLPTGLTLQVYDAQGVIAQAHEEQRTTTSFLYAQVVGLLTEAFRVQIGIPDGPMITLPPFTFQPSETAGS